MFMEPSQEHSGGGEGAGEDRGITGVVVDLDVLLASLRGTLSAEGQPEGSGSVDGNASQVKPGSDPCPRGPEVTTEIEIRTDSWVTLKSEHFSVEELGIEFPHR